MLDDCVEELYGFVEELDGEDTCVAVDVRLGVERASRNDQSELAHLTSNRDRSGCE